MLALLAAIVGALLLVLGAQASDAACTIVDASKLRDGSADDWSHANGLILSAQPDQAGVYQVHTLRDDGSLDTCLTCRPSSDAPQTNRHKIDANWHPSGSYFVTQGEMDNHPLQPVHTLGFISEFIANGLWSNLYAATADGQRWFRLTDYSSIRADGAMAPFFSPDGARLVWSRMVAPASKTMPFGQYRLMLADFVLDADGAPGLQNIRDITPDGATFIEPHGFSPDGHKILFASDLGLDSVWSMDISTLDLESGELTNLTHSHSYEEHATYTLGGDRIAYMSSEPYPGTFLQTELMLMDVDGSNKRQLTHFNVPGYPESVNEQAMPVWLSWNADGSAMAITLQLGGLQYPKRELWVLRFAGPCGV